MLQRRWPLVLSALIVLVLGARFAWVFDALPARVGSHYDLAGEADSFQDKGSFVLLSLGLHVALWLMFAGLPLLARQAPRLVNMPRRAYWLAPERREETLLRLSPVLDWMGLATMAFTAATAELTLRANLSGKPLNNSLVMLLACGFVAVLGMCVWRLRRLFA